ncbi:gamma-glutamyltransferase family protein [Leptospira gomenensis]|uniref:Gamma-glutamyltransferase family protein n=2 Tax=Leptospira gomenensis TaxID=2484974 RepID=A0A5F1YET0_9LEPT|nr:gamma-glutamyltransferase family protein [Leptospira gomenensis]TGK40083.1 gamma-glutamyltransferase family protein [Leptospira gomenensis]TGK51558.1 gamma-glutamyltransferase family protein [Leptospira gomenensis]TGK68111.1 gamma-glutamyltransferase family protein [Leptospira gomenensis]
MVATGHPLATKTALEMLKRGGNAADAGIAALLVLNVVQGEEASFPGVAPLLYYDSKSNRVESYIGAGKAPSKATIEYFRSRGHEYIPALKYSSQLVPASPDVIVALLKKYGTMSFEQVSAPAIEIAEQGFPVHRILMRNLNMNIFKRIGFYLLLPYNAEVYLENRWWKPLYHKEIFRRPRLAKTLRELVDVEFKSKQNGADRNRALDFVRNYFYEGPIAQKIVKAHEQNDGTITQKDLTEYSGAWERPLQGRFGSYTIFSNQTWNQGAVVPIVLQILEGIDLKSMKHNSPLYVHTVIQAIELAMADREKFFGDPAFVNVPSEGLLSKEYASERRKLLQPTAFGKTPSHGNPFAYQKKSVLNSLEFQKQRKDSLPSQNHSPVDQNRFSTGTSSDSNPNTSLLGRVIAKLIFFQSSLTFHSSLNDQQLSLWEKTGKVGRDTTYLSIIDAQGNSLSLTPSDFPQSPMIDGDITLGIRMTQFRLDPNHPSALLPGKRPTITPNASMVFKNGKFLMSLGTPGGDMQTQATIQVFLNMFVFGMDPQTAVEKPRFRSLNWTDSFSPHNYYPGRIELEKDIFELHGKTLEKLGYEVVGRGVWEYDFGAPCVSLKNPMTGKLYGGADPRKESWAEGK